MHQRNFHQIGFVAIAEGQSMKPFIYQGDKLHIRPIYFKSLKVDDIVVFRRKNKLVTHRIIYKKQKYVITKGDNNRLSDGRIAPPHIVGIVDKIKRKSLIFDPKKTYLSQSSTYFQEISTINAVLMKKDIDFVFLNGLPIHPCYEKSLGHYSFECSLLMNQSNLKKVEEVLIRFGYKETNVSFSKIHRLWPKSTIEVSYYKKIKGLVVFFNIHLQAVFLMTQINNLNALYPNVLLANFTKDLLQTKIKVGIDQQNFYLLEKKFFILYLALHFFHHNYRGVHRLELINTIIKKSHLSRQEWQELNDLIVKYRFGNFVHPIFILLKKYFDTQIGITLTDKFIPRVIRKTRIFDDESNIRAEINRFMMIFQLSPQPFLGRLLVFGNIHVLYFAFWSLARKLRLSFSRE